MSFWLSMFLMIFWTAPRASGWWVKLPPHVMHPSCSFHARHTTHASAHFSVLNTGGRQKERRRKETNLEDGLHGDDATFLHGLKRLLSSTVPHVSKRKPKQGGCTTPGAPYMQNLLCLLHVLLLRRVEILHRSEERRVRVRVRVFQHQE
jgi:hypothetical protein